MEVDKNKWTLNGDLFFGTARELQNKVEKMGQVNGNITLDVNNVTHVDATGRSVLRMIAETQRKNGYKLLIEGNQKLSNLLNP